MGVRAIAIHSEADRDSPHVVEADEAYPVGPAPASESYLRIDRIIEIARACGAEAIHPGYGFLAERASFARAVGEAGLTFVGPTAETIAAMGAKTEARRRMRKAGVPIVPGIVDPVRSAEEAVQIGERLGYPLLLKAVAGGGGKGMRPVHEPKELPQAFAAAYREARSAFGDGTLYLERYLPAPRHIEIQVLGDATGRVVHLGERECSIQRRHQKLVEEAPSPCLTPGLRGTMGAAAVRAAREVGYVGAGTVEFLYERGDFHFLEMNTRLQVEHPVTELVTGIDLVAWQLRIAAGETLDFGQEDIALRGHAIECRITSESPENGFLPATGRIDRLTLPSGPGVRWDGGIIEGSEIGLHYDSLLGKLIVHASSRAGAIQRMRRALDELVIGGVETSASLHHRIMENPAFRDGRLSIRFLQEYPELLEGALSEEEVRRIAIAAALLEDDGRRHRTAGRIGAGRGGSLSSWRSGGYGRDAAGAPPRR